MLEAAAALGYRPDRTASLLARRRRHLLGVLMDVHSSYHAELVEDLHDAAEARGYDLVLSTLTRSRDERRAVETLLDFRCDALILLGPESSSARLDGAAATAAGGLRGPAADLTGRRRRPLGRRPGRRRWPSSTSRAWAIATSRSSTAARA